MTKAETALVAGIVEALNLLLLPRWLSELFIDA